MKSVKDIYIFVGPPGSGKGSLSHLCKKNLGWAHLSTGNLCRQHIARMTDIGLKIDHAIKSGKLIDDELMIDMVASWIQEATELSSGIILDGFPRTVAQARALDYLFAQDNFNNSSVTVVSMNIHDDHVMFETLLQLRYKIKTVIFANNNKGFLYDPSLKLILKMMGFKNCITLDEFEEIEFRKPCIGS